MITEAHDQHRLARQFALEVLDEFAVVARADCLAAQIFVGLGRVAWVAPARRCQIGPIRMCPRKMIGGVVDQHEHRRGIVLARDQLDRVVVVE